MRASTLTQREFYRRGPNHRASQENIGFLQIRKRFQFASVRVGKWVREYEKAHMAPLFYDALCDLMSILGVDERVISLRGSLALQYGCGGQPGVSAHYEPATRSFSLAKNAGPGSLAHEWFHGFDHYICDKAFAGQHGQGFASAVWLEDASVHEHPLNTRLLHCFQTIILNEEGSEASDYFTCSAKMDRVMGAYYFSQPQELCARAFEAFVQDANIKNNFLVSGSKQSQEAKLGLYPQGDHRRRINQSFADYFSMLGQMLKRSD